MSADPDDVRRFAATFQQFLDEVVHAAPAARPNELVDRLRAHLGDDPVALPVATARWPGYEHVNVHRAVDAALSRPGRSADLVGVGTRLHHVEGLSALLEAAMRHRMVDIGPVERTMLATSPDTSEVAVALGLYLATVDDVPLALLLSAADPERGRQQIAVEVLCADTAAAEALLAEIRAEAVAGSVFRGQVLSFDPSDFGPAAGPIRFNPRPHVERGALVLPDGVLDVVERQVVGIAEHRAQLRAAGQHLKRGVLLHGPPGTGKTLTVRYLLARLPDFTVVLLAGQTLRFIGAACALARLLQPALVVLEDCDLVAEDRTMSYGPQPLLFEVLNELDGMAEDADVVFLLTTNRVDLLEPALAERPGRVDQAVEIALPDAAARRALFALYTRRLMLDPDVDVDAVVERSAGTTASFMKELARRAALLAAGGTTTGVPTVRNADVLAALDELTEGSATLTRRLLGARQGDAG